MGKLKELLERRAEIDRQIEDTRRTERADAVARIRELMDEYDLTTADLSNRAVARSSGAGAKTGARGASGKVAPKYRNQATGDTWSGRGLQPKWLKAALASGRKIEDFAV